MNRLLDNRQLSDIAASSDFKAQKINGCLRRWSKEYCEEYCAIYESITLGPMKCGQLLVGCHLRIPMPHLGWQCGC